ncbi:MAG: hypothetical protein ACYC6Y_19360, partial [Thermoguttaceae bacterium]
HVSGPAGARATVLVQGLPLIVDRENVLFDRIDFVWRPGPLAGAGNPSPVIVRLEAAQVRFRRCTFQAAAEAGKCSAIGWVFPVDRNALALPSGRISLADCVFHRVDAAVDARAAAALSIDCDNLLHLGPGPLLRLDHAPPVDEPIDLVLKNVTLRQAASVLEVHDSGPVQKSATISIDARLCVFEPGAAGGLLRFFGAAAPAGLAEAISWTGEGALLTPGLPVAQWIDASGKITALNEEAFSMAGLVRSPVEFAGPFEPAVASSAAIRWQAPLPTADAPGIRPDSVPQPPRGEREAGP